MPVVSCLYIFIVFKLLIIIYIYIYKQIYSEYSEIFSNLGNIRISPTREEKVLFSKVYIHKNCSISEFF